jgi:hypothetical protein
MKCPHCNTGIAEVFTGVQLNIPAGISRPDRPSYGFTWVLSRERCPECDESIVNLQRAGGPKPVGLFLAYPASRSRPTPAGVMDPYKQDLLEACKVLQDSPKASAALSRRCLQMVLRDKAGTKSKDLYDQIEEVAGKVPSHIGESLHAVRNIGNFAAHPLKSTNTGEIVEVENHEAEWNLDVLELLFDFYFVQPAIAAKRKADVNKKLKDASTSELP